MVKAKDRMKHRNSYGLGKLDKPKAKTVYLLLITYYLKKKKKKIRLLLNIKSIEIITGYHEKALVGKGPISRKLTPS